MAASSHGPEISNNQAVDDAICFERRVVKLPKIGTPTGPHEAFRSTLLNVGCKSSRCSLASRASALEAFGSLSQLGLGWVWWVSARFNQLLAQRSDSTQRIDDEGKKGATPHKATSQLQRGAHSLRFAFFERFVVENPPGARNGVEPPFHLSAWRVLPRGGKSGSANYSHVDDRDNINLCQKGQS